MSDVLKYCLQMNSIACANEQIPEEYVKSAFLGIVHLHILHTFLNSIVFKNTSYHILHAGETAFHTASVRKQV